MRDLTRELVVASIDGRGIAAHVIDVGGQFLVSGVDIAANTIEGIDPYTLWLAPERCLVVGGSAPRAEFVSDVSEGLVVIDISGARTDDVLAMACPLDPASLALGHCAQSLFAGVKVILYRHGDALRLHVERPLASWLLDWLRQAIGAFEG